MRGLTLGRGTDDARRRPARSSTRPRATASHKLVEDAVGKGADVLVGGEPRDGAGYFYEPTVLAGVPSDALVQSEEIFGPVAPVIAVRRRGRGDRRWPTTTEYGLVAYVFTQDLNRAFRVVEALETGMVGLNQGMVSNAGAPFGGVKQSGYGREGGPEGIAGVPGDEVRRDEPGVGAGRPTVRARTSARGGWSRTAPSRPRGPRTAASAIPVGFGPDRKSTLTTPTRPSPNSR